MAIHPALQPAVDAATQQAAVDATAKANAAKAVSVTPTVATLKGVMGSANTLTILMGRINGTDGLSGTYYWDPASTEADDTKYLNVVAPTAVAVGRWKRITTRVLELPQGTLVTGPGGVKTLYATAAVVGAAGQVVLNLTTNNLPDGPAIFSEIWENTSMVKPPVTAAVIEDTITTSVLTEVAKQTTHVATRGNKSTLPAVLTAVAGTVITPLRYAPAGTQLRITVTGI